MLQSRSQTNYPLLLRIESISSQQEIRRALEKITFKSLADAISLAHFQEEELPPLDDDLRDLLSIPPLSPSPSVHPLAKPGVFPIT